MGMRPLNRIAPTAKLPDTLTHITPDHCKIVRDIVLEQNQKYFLGMDKAEANTTLKKLTQNAVRLKQHAQKIYGLEGKVLDTFVLAGIRLDARNKIDLEEDLRQRPRELLGIISDSFDHVASGNHGGRALQRESDFGIV